MDRTVIERSDRDSIRSKKLTIDEAIEKYNSHILKDMDFRDLGVNFHLTKKDSNILTHFIKNDSEFLRQYNLTDYSLLVTIHHYTKIDYEKSYKNQRIMKSNDGKYLYNFSIIDFLSVIILIYLRNMIYIN